MGTSSFPFTKDLLDIASMYENAAFSAFHVQSPTSEDSPLALLLHFDPNDSQSSLCDWFFGHHSSPKTCAMIFSSSLDPSTSAVLAPREPLLVAFPGTDPPGSLPVYTSSTMIPYSIAYYPRIRRVSPI